MSRGQITHAGAGADMKDLEVRELIAI